MRASNRPTAQTKGIPIFGGFEKRKMSLVS